MKGFYKWIFDSPAVMRYIVVACLMSMVYFILQKFHHREPVAYFDNYISLANDFAHGSIPLSSTDNNSPFQNLLFLPALIFPAGLASGIYYFVVLSSFIFFTLILLYYHELYGWSTSKIRGWTLFLITFFLLDHFERELHLGNLNVFLLIATFAIFILVESRRYIPAGLIWAFLILCKPATLILLFFFVLKKNMKVPAIMLAGVLGIGFLALLIPGLSAGTEWMKSWIGLNSNFSVLIHEHPNSLWGMLYCFFSALGLELPEAAVIVLTLILLLSMLFFLYKLFLKRSNNSADYLIYFVLVGSIPNLVRTDTEHFMWTWPLLVFIFTQLLSGKGIWRTSITIALAVVFIPYCLNSPDIVGKKIRFILDETGLLGMANIVILLLAVIIYQIRLKENQQVIGAHTI
jgi:hypothetical protein